MEQEMVITENKKVAAKRVDIVKIQMVKEGSLLYKNRTVHSPQNAFDLMKQFLGDVDREHFVVVCLDSKNQPIALNTCHIGSLNSSIVHPREVFKTAILSNAASIMVGHNHPSGNPEPSEADIRVTRRLEEAGELMGIRLLDHLIIGEDTYVSLKERGNFKTEE
ncbi:DNA repair protein RadC [Listeria monocytogenes]|nr:DNA repair protein RadC [Listeria monocytogenes]EAC3732543.1 DNA repair protein RadC [Listeria monocytogenes]EAC5165193.1 DNA repair protein RadC [Listeria monocytogenes]EAC7371410.1 DNA repair protein RadC [Listeria monocytogenes]EAC9315335.1 DNA repair protein RadC [Listeria monocytogenes]